MPSARKVMQPDNFIDLKGLEHLMFFPLNPDIVLTSPCGCWERRAVDRPSIFLSQSVFLTTYLIMILRCEKIEAIVARRGFGGGLSMPEIIGPFKSISSTVSFLDAHIAHLRHLTNTGIARELLIKRFQFTAAQAKETAKLIGAHIGQSLEFHHQSRVAPITIRPVLQYYSYLNLAVATILAYRPPNYNQYRQHGVEDRTHALSSLDLSSIVLRVKQKGAVPLFHAIISDVPLKNQRFRFGQLAAGFHMISHELETQFGKTPQAIQVIDEVKNISGSWYSEFSFTSFVGVKKAKIAPKKLEDAMPLLAADYQIEPSADEQIIYRSVASWSNQAEATRVHKTNGLKLINFGGHSFPPVGRPQCAYAWRGVSRVSLLPTLTSLMLLAFTLASVARYRPALLHKALNSPINLIVDTFIQEADAIYIPTIRNLLYREEIAVGQINYS